MKGSESEEWSEGEEKRMEEVKDTRLCCFYSVFAPPVRHIMWLSWGKSRPVGLRLAKRRERCSHNFIGLAHNDDKALITIVYVTFSYMRSRERRSSPSSSAPPPPHDRHRSRHHCLADERHPQQSIVNCNTVPMVRGSHAFMATLNSTGQVYKIIVMGTVFSSQVFTCWKSRAVLVQPQPPCCSSYWAPLCM